MLPIRKEWGFPHPTLDIGVGAGRKRGSVGVDLRRTDLVDVVADGTNLPFMADSFAAVVCYHVVEHLTPPEIRRLTAEMARVCRSSGRVHVLVDRDVSREALLAKDPTHRERYGIEDIRTLCNHYLTIETMQTHNLLGNVHNHPLTWPRYVPKATKVYLKGRPRSGV